MNLRQRQKALKEKTNEYRTNRNETVRFLREDMGFSFGEIAREFGVSKQRVYQIFKEAKNES